MRSPFVLSASALVAAAVLAVLPAIIDPFFVTVASLIFMYAFLGVAWNLMFGYAGQLSIGHALFFGVGAYTAAILSNRYGINAWLGVAAGAMISAALGSLIAALGFRFSVRGQYFALLTVAAAEFVRIWFENWDFTGGSAGYFLKVPDQTSPFISLRGSATFFYEAFLILALSSLALSYTLTRSRYGFYWRAIREDEDVARAIGVPVFRMKILVVTISAAMTSIGGSLFLFFSGGLFPDTVLGMRFSIEIMIAPIIGGAGTLIGPFVGALFVVPAMEFSNYLSQKASIFGLSTFIYGLLILTVVRFLPDGVWPALEHFISNVVHRRAPPARSKPRDEAP